MKVVGFVLGIVVLGVIVGGVLTVAGVTGDVLNRVTGRQS